MRYSTRVSRYTSQACIVYRLGKLNIVSCRVWQYVQYVQYCIVHNHFTFSKENFCKFATTLLLLQHPPPPTSPPPCMNSCIAILFALFCIVYRLVYRDIFRVSTRVSTRQEICDIAQPYHLHNIVLNASCINVQHPTFCTLILTYFNSLRKHYCVKVFFTLTSVYKLC